MVRSLYHSDACTVNMKQPPAAAYISLAKRLETVGTASLVLTEGNQIDLPAHLLTCHISPV